MQLNCANGQKNVMSHVFFNTPEGTLIGLLHDGPSEYWVLGSLFVLQLFGEKQTITLLINLQVSTGVQCSGVYSVVSLLILAGFYFVMSCWTYGLGIASGAFASSLLIGACWGRLYGIGMVTLFPFIVS